MTSHVKHHCPERLVKCRYCRSLVVFREQTVHENLCCPFLCGQRREGEGLREHFLRCPLVRVICPVVGCGTVVVRELLEKHMNEESGMHVTLLLAYNERLSALVERLSIENNWMKNSERTCCRCENGFLNPLKERKELEWVDESKMEHNEVGGQP